MGDEAAPGTGHLPAASSMPPLPILILGHSFVKRLTRFAIDRGCHNMALGEKYEVFFHGISGLKLAGLTREIDMVQTLRPTIVFLEIGTNDLASGAVGPELAHEVSRFARRLISHHHVEVVIISQVVFRDSKSSRYRLPEGFNSKVTEYNQTMRELTKGDNRILFWRHRGLWAAWEKYLSDGVHFNQAGLRKYYNSVRGAVVAALNQYGLYLLPRDGPARNKLSACAPVSTPARQRLVGKPHRESL